MRAAVIQMNSGEDTAANLRTAERLLGEAARGGAELAVLPEIWTYLGRSEGHRAAAEAIPGPTSALLCAIARRHRLALVAGSYFEAVPGQERLSNTSLAIQPDGSIAAVYRKLHLFDVDVDGVDASKKAATSAAAPSRHGFYTALRSQSTYRARPESQS